MADILLSRTPCHLNSLENVIGIYPDQVIDITGRPAKMIMPYQPYLIGESVTEMDKSILLTMNYTQISSTVTDMALAFGPRNTMAIAEITGKLREHAKEHAFLSTGAAGDAAARRIEGFGKSLEEYQHSLMKYQEAIINKAPRHAAKIEAENALNKTNKMFGSELASIDHRNASKSPLKSFKRATGLVRGNPNFSTLEITDMFQASWLAKLAKAGKVLGSGVVAIDFGSRAVSLAGASAAGENIYREMFIESLSFATSASAGVIALNAGAFLAEAALTCFLAATPAGWVLVVVGLAVAGLAGGVSIGVDKYFKNNGGAMYDKIMKWMGT